MRNRSWSFKNPMKWKNYKEYFEFHNFHFMEDESLLALSIKFQTNAGVGLKRGKL